MALIWQKTVEDKRYEVRSAGQTCRLYTNGVFHSQFNPSRQLTSNVWDLLSLPSFFLDPGSIRRVLVLGVGGGAALRQLLNWYPKLQIVGVELDKIHIDIGQRFFGLADKRIKLIQANAIEWVKSYRGLAFDLIIEDLFAEVNQEPQRVIGANADWLNYLAAHLTSHGMLVMNFTEAGEFKQNAAFHQVRLKRRFKQIYKFTTPLYENNIAVMLQAPCTVNLWRKRILATPILAGEYQRQVDKVKVRKLIG